MEGRLSGKSLPHNEDAERSLLGALILDSDRVGEITEILEPEDFFDRRHQILYDTLRRLNEANIPADFISVGEELKAAGRFHEVGGVEYLGELGRAVTSSAFAPHHAQIISETSILRALIREGTEIVAKAYETRPTGEAVK